MGVVLWVLHTKVGKVVSSYSAAIRNGSEPGEVELEGMVARLQGAGQEG